MTTEAGRRLLDDWVPAPSGHEADCDECRAVIHEEHDEAAEKIAAIEAEARRALLAEIRAEMEGKDSWDFGSTGGEFYVRLDDLFGILDRAEGETR